MREPGLLGTPALVAYLASVAPLPIMPEAGRSEEASPT
jgi:hypothetical protein